MATEKATSIPKLEQNWPLNAVTGFFPGAGTISTSPNIVWQGTTSGSTYTSANTALGGGGGAGGSSWHPPEEWR